VGTTSYGIIVEKEGLPAKAVADTTSAVTLPVAASGKIYVNGEVIEIAANESQASIMTKLRNLCDSININLTANDAVAAPATAEVPLTDANAHLVFTSKESGSDQSITISCTDPTLAIALGLDTITTTAKGTDAKVSIPPTGSGFNNTATVSTDGNIVTITDSNGFEMKLEIDEKFVDPAIVPTTPNAIITILDAGTLGLQVGANEGQMVDVKIPQVSPKTLGIENINLNTEDGAEAGITLLDTAINDVSAIRAKLGAYQNRLDHAIANLDVGAENMTEALSRIEDVDMAEEMANYTQKNVLAQAGTSMLAQANERPQTILSLLQG
jgi:flagellin